MYDKKQKAWISDCNTDDLKLQCKNPDFAEDSYTRFLKASELLSQIKTADNVAIAVAAMHDLAKEDYPPAVFAMGQMCYYGWGVNKDKNRGIEWYKQSAAADYKPAVETLAQMKKAKRMKILSAVLSVVIVIAVVTAVISTLLTAGKQIIKVHEDTELSQVTSAKEFSAELSDLISEYDTELVISGEVSTNRIVLKFEGNRLDLSDFLADKVIARDNNIVVLQFSSEEEAQKCLEQLKNEDKIIFVETDAYTITSEAVGEKYCTLQPVGSTDDTSDYYSWGVPDMGLDKLSEYVRNATDTGVVVAVIDSGALIHEENAHRYIEGYNMVTGGAVFPDEHGTHVAGTVLDGARSDNILVWNIDVFNGSEYSTPLLVASAVELATEAEVDVINMSLGGPCNLGKELSIKDAIASGISVVVAAGNETEDTALGNSCPSDMQEVISVGAYDINHEICWFSNYGDSVDVCAPGEEIWSYSHKAQNLLARLQGTSMAAPHISALAALLKSLYPNATPKEIEDMICGCCRTFTNPTDFESGDYGAGAPDATVFIEQ